MTSCGPIDTSGRSVNRNTCPLQLYPAPSSVRASCAPCPFRPFNQVAAMRSGMCCSSALAPGTICCQRATSGRRTALGCETLWRTTARAPSGWPGRACERRSGSTTAPTPRSHCTLSTLAMETTRTRGRLLAAPPSPSSQRMWARCSRPSTPGKGPHLSFDGWSGSSRCRSTSALARTIRPFAPQNPTCTCRRVPRPRRRCRRPHVLCAPCPCARMPPCAIATAPKPSMTGATASRRRFSPRTACRWCHSPRRSASAASSTRGAAIAHTGATPPRPAYTWREPR
mmetsp:Transcript_15756/g.36082  ORF Transcript_15756/g.36082 Transcript_15756/m.36082 type:complete len:284 (+) Transcript_15756:475-1326(+)